MSAGSRYRVRGALPLRGRVAMPADVPAAHRMSVLAALCEGTTRIRGPEALDAISATIDVLRQVGISSEPDPDGTLHVHGRGMNGLTMPAGGVLRCGSDATTLKLACGMLAAQPFGTRISADTSLAELPLTPLLQPLRARGAHISGTVISGSDDLGAPVAIAPLLEDETLHGLRCELGLAAPDTKTALFLSGLFASGPTAIWEPWLSPDHFERMLSALGVPVENMGPMVAIDPEGWAGTLAPGSWEVPGSPTCAAAVMVALQLIPHSKAVLTGVALNPSRGGLPSMLRLMGAPLEVIPRGETTLGEPLGDIHVGFHRGLRGGIAAAELLARMHGELAALLPLGAVASGRTEVDWLEIGFRRDMSERLVRVAEAFGVRCEATELGLRIHGGRQPTPARLSCAEDPDAALAALLFALAAPGESVLEHASCLERSCPGLVKVLRLLGADIGVEGAP